MMGGSWPVLFGKRRSGGTPPPATYADKIAALGSTAKFYYALNDTTGTIADDYTANALDAAYNGGTLASSAGPGASMGNVVLEDGVNDYVLPPTSAVNSAWNKDEGSMMIWVKCPSQPFAIIANVGVSNSNWYVLFVSGATIYCTTAIAGVRKFNDYAVALVANTWTHLAITWSLTGGFHKFYLNGVLQSTAANAVAFVGSLVNTHTSAGAEGTGTSALQGNLAGWLLCNTALSDASVANLAVAV